MQKKKVFFRVKHKQYFFRNKNKQDDTTANENVLYGKQIRYYFTCL